MTSVYDHLKDLKSWAARKAVADLFALAGQLGAIGESGAWLFQEQSTPLVDGVTHTPVYDLEYDKLIGYIDDPGSFIVQVIFGKDERFQPERNYYMRPKVTAQEAHQLRQLRHALQEELKSRGGKAAEEFALLGAVLGGERMSKEFVWKMLVEKGLPITRPEE